MIIYPVVMIITLTFNIQARHVPYINVEEEEWEKFQKEIGEEMSTAQTILVEDREEVSSKFKDVTKLRAGDDTLKFLVL